MLIRLAVGVMLASGACAVVSGRGGCSVSAEGRTIGAVSSAKCECGGVFESSVERGCRVGECSGCGFAIRLDGDDQKWIRMSRYAAWVRLGDTDALSGEMLRVFTEGR